MIGVSIPLPERDCKRLGELASWLHHNQRVSVDDETLDLLRRLAYTQPAVTNPPAPMESKGGEG
jgi:hypothetical protein